MRVLRKSHGTLDTVGEEEASEVVELCALDNLLDLWLLEVVLGELLSRTELGAEGAVVPRENDGARSRWGILDDLVGRVKSLALVGGTELVGQGVLANATNVGGRVVWEDVLEEEGERGGR